jgi:hypothetical protein
MVLADTSQTERIRVLRARTLAVARRNALLSAQASGFYAFELGPGGQTLSDSVRTSRMIGQMTYTRMNANQSSLTTVEPCCPPPQ